MARVSTTTLTGIEPLCVRYVSRNSSYHSVVPANGPTNRRSSEATVSGSSSHAAALNWLQARQPGRGHPQFAVDGPLYSASAGSVCEVLEGLAFVRAPGGCEPKHNSRGPLLPQRFSPDPR
jgi:hypothetical protein